MAVEHQLATAAEAKPLSQKRYQNLQAGPRRWLAAMVLLLALPVLAWPAGGFYHKVQKNESLDAIARRYRVPVYEIAKANRLQVSAAPSAGANIWIPSASQQTAPKAPELVRAAAKTAPSAAAKSSAPAGQAGEYIVRPGDSLWKVAANHGVTVEALASANGMSTKTGLEVGQKLKLPPAGGLKTSSKPGGGDFREAEAQAKPKASTTKSGSEQTRTASRESRQGYIWPVEGRIIQEFKNSSSSKHSGIDIAVAAGTEVRAAREGTVIFAGNSISAYGNMIIIRHDGDFASCYAYNSKLLVRQDQRVKQGQVIALSGDSGKLERPTLHFQLRKKGDAVNPVPYLP